MFCLGYWQLAIVTTKAYIEKLQLNIYVSLILKLKKQNFILLLR